MAETLPATGGAAIRARPNTRVLGVLALGHLVVDMNQGALPPLLPFLKTAFGLSYAASGAILLVANVTSSLVPPIFGSVTVALGQAYHPRQLGMAAGLIVGLAIGTGGVGVTVLGWVADHWGLYSTWSRSCRSPGSPSRSACPSRAPEVS